jgi:2-polyprenyl-3-methyl-5-hydroxy-6-metoxy-1,4-benzoquinol methylase
MTKSQKDLHGKAILDYYEGKKEHLLWLHNSYGEPEEMPVEVFFRDAMDFSVLENLALIACRGSILDLGAGAGALSLALQATDCEVYAMETSRGCLKVLHRRGVQHIIAEGYEQHRGQYDTVLVMMNGLGLAGKLEYVPGFVRRCMQMVRPGGQLLIDSSDIRYLYGGAENDTPHYYGEVRYRYAYKALLGAWFDWVYVDPQTLKAIIDGLGMAMDILHIDANDQYLARISAK